MRKIGIVTLSGKFNYGNRLQNYAVSKAIEMVGCVPTSLYLLDRPNFSRATKNLAKRILGISAPHPEANMSPLRLASFEKFNRLIPHKVINSIPADLCDEYDFFLVGSDQVWNPGLIKYNEDWFFLKFARPEQRIALAASIGLDHLSSKQAKTISKGVNGFSSVSIREFRGAELLQEAAGIEASVICDPTLVLTPDEWRSIADDRLTPTASYVFTYLLGGDSAESMETLKQCSELSDYMRVSLSDRQKPGEPDAGPSEFISLVSNASHVITDSFHAAVFACIFEKPLTIVHRDGAQMFSRLEGLAKSLGIEGKIYGHQAFDFSKAGDYRGVSEAIQVRRSEFIAYLEGLLS